ncbi:MAG TPA: ATP-binding protein [Candidatus Udaeobacter sp.]|nr:ATP-binding protein [Candidatus Udaeobacter sp.]
MNFAATVAQDLTAAGFIALGAAIAYRWYRERLRGQAALSLALVNLAIVAALGRIQGALPGLWELSIVTIVAFILSSYFVLMFRNEFIPLSPALRRGANVLLVLAIAVGLADVIFLRSGPPVIVSALGFFIVATWAVFVGEPIVRFWLASNAVPAVQRARLRFFSFGFAVLIAILIIDVVGGRALQSPTAILITQLIAMAAVPAIYVSFAPPALLRRIWRMSEESAVRAAMQDLLIFSPTRQAMAERATFWAVRMTGATAAFIVGGDGTVMATSGIDPTRVSQLLRSPELDPPSVHRSVIQAPLHLGEETGVLGVVAGPFTPVFGSEEIVQLKAYANSVSAGLERARVTERMAALEQNKSQFLNLASHELRGPVTVLRGYVSMLEGGMLGTLNDRGRKAAGVMAAKVSEMNELIEEMIDAARLEEGGLTLRIVEADLRDIARSAIEAVTPMLGPKHRMEVDLPDRRVRVNADPDRTKTIIANLLSNAIKYSPAGGLITCRVASRGGVARVAVSDEGLGIARENIPTLFTRFGRVITPETEHLKGTGLGLFLARQLARLQRGDITVTSVEGKGSTFTLQLLAAGSLDGTGEQKAGSADGAAEREPDPHARLRATS